MNPVCMIQCNKVCKKSVITVHESVSARCSCQTTVQRVCTEDLIADYIQAPQQQEQQ
jgi:hypothetical protein